MSILKTGHLGGDRTTRSLFHYTSDGEAVLEQTNDVSGILRANHFQRSEQTLHHTSETTNHVARIDVLAIKKWMATRGITRNWWSQFFNDDNLLREFLNDPDNRVWRTRLGKV